MAGEDKISRGLTPAVLLSHRTRRGFPGGAPLLALRWPAVQNFNVFKGDSRADMTLWLDQTKPPIAKS